MGEDNKLTAIQFLRRHGIHKGETADWIVRFKSWEHVVHLMEAYANDKIALNNRRTNEDIEYLEACKGQSLLDVKLATDHKNACIEWERAMMDLLGEDGIDSVTESIKNLKNKATYNELMLEDREVERRKLYTDILIAYSQAANSVEPARMRQWADRALEAFDEKFPNPIK